VKSFNFFRRIHDGEALSTQALRNVMVLSDGILSLKSRSFQVGSRSLRFEEVGRGDDTNAATFLNAE
jgi:hypothetical protein